MIYGENSPEAKKKRKKREQTSGQGLPLTGEQGDSFGTEISNSETGLKPTKGLQHNLLFLAQQKTEQTWGL